MSMDKPVTTNASTPPALDHYITVAEAAALVRVPGAGRTPEIKLRRYLLRRERVLGTEILIRFGTPASPRYRLTLSSLRVHCPELFDVRSDITHLFRAHVAELEEKLERVELQNEALAAAVRRLR